MAVPSLQLSRIWCLWSAAALSVQRRKLCWSVGFTMLILVSGCSTWSATTVPDLPLPRMPHDSVVFEAAFVRVPVDVPLDDLWPQVDEQHMDSETRREHRANGIRSGVLGTQLPIALQELMESADDEQSAAGASELMSESVTSLYRKLQNRAGEPADLVVVPTIADRKVILFSEQGHVRAESFNQGQALFVVRGYPAGDGTVRLELVPEIRHGQVKHQWAPGNGTFLYDSARPAKSFEQYRISSVLSPGQTLLVTGTNEPRGLGGAVVCERHRRVVGTADPFAAPRANAVRRLVCARTSGRPSGDSARLDAISR